LWERLPAAIMPPDGDNRGWKPLPPAIKPETSVFDNILSDKWR